MTLDQSLRRDRRPVDRGLEEEAILDLLIRQRREDMDIRVITLQMHGTTHVALPPRLDAFLVISTVDNVIIFGSEGGRIAIHAHRLDAVIALAVLDIDVMLEVGVEHEVLGGVSQGVHEIAHLYTGDLHQELGILGLIVRGPVLDDVFPHAGL